MTFSPPPKDDETLLRRLEQRTDDTEEKIKVRLEHFHENTEVVKEIYTDILVEVDGTGKPEDIAKEIEEGIESSNKSATSLFCC